MVRAIPALIFAAACSVAQTQSGGIRGRVTDPSGSVVAGARVSVTERSSASRSGSDTGPDGMYAFSALIPGEWLIEAHARGFGSSGVKSISLPAGGSVTADLKLELQPVATQIQVTAAGGAQTVDELAKALT